MSRLQGKVETHTGESCDVNVFILICNCAFHLKTYFRELKLPQNLKEQLKLYMEEWVKIEKKQSLTLKQEKKFLIHMLVLKPDPVRI